MAPAARAQTQDRPRIAPADLIFLAIVFLAVCAAFAIAEGLSLEIPGSAGALAVTAFPDGRLAVDGRSATMESVESAVRSALALDPNLLIVVRRGPNTDHQLVIDLLDRLKRAGATRIAIKGMG